MGARASGARTAAAAAFFTALAWASRAPSFASSVLDSDEGVYLAMARALLRGAMPYTEVWDHKPPGVYVLYAAFLRLFGESVLAIRIGATLFVAATALLAALLAARLFGRFSLGILAGCLYVLAAARGPGLAANAELFFAPFAVGAWLLLAPAGEESLGAGRVFLAGLCAGVAVQIKLVAVLELVALAAWTTLREPSPARARLRLLVALGAGAWVPFALVGLWFLSSGLLPLYLSTNFAANLRYAAGGRVPAGGALGEWRETLLRDWPLWAGAALFAAWPARGEAGFSRAKKFVALLAAGEALGVLAAGRTYGHYLVEILPALALAGAGLAARALAARPAVRLPIAAAGTLAAALWTAPIAAASVRYARAPAQGPDAAARVAAAVREELRAGDTLWVPLFEPTVYFLVDARAATRFVMPTTLLDESIARAAGVDRAVELRRVLAAEPTWIVALERPPKIPGVPEAEALLRPALAADYERRARIDGVEVYRRRRTD